MNKDQFLSEVQAAAALPSPKEAERWSKAVLGALTHLVSDSMTRRHFITQLPGFVKRPLLAEPPQSLLMDPEALIQHVGARLGTRPPEAERALAAVWGVLRRAIAAGELEDFQARIPEDVAAYLRRLA